MPFFIINSVLLLTTGVMIYESTTNAKTKFNKQRERKKSKKA
ncbi:hypothetical protein [Campylobacter corcagiensis]|nr:hypothetical protein [Campylobacter corcagiensis]